MKLPNSINILGITYTIQYVNNPTEVDMNKRESLWGQIDYWTRKIRIYKNDRPLEDIWKTIFHEILHGIAEELHLNEIKENEKTIDLLATGITDVLFRNNLMK